MDMVNNYVKTIQFKREKVGINAMEVFILHTIQYTCNNKHNKTKQIHIAMQQV